MPRANRHFLPGHIWHLTQRCHRRAFLLKFARDRKRWRLWLFEAKRRYGLQVLNYQVLSNHIHLLVRDAGHGEIADSLQLVSGRTAQEYNLRKRRHGAFWQDRYHATAVESGTHLKACMTYIDLNVVRAGIVSHPNGWPDSSYYELSRNSRKYRITSLPALQELLGFDTVQALRQARDRWLGEAIASGDLRRDERWTEALAVGSKDYVETVQTALGGYGRHKKTEQQDVDWLLRDSAPANSRHLGAENIVIRPQNAKFEDKFS